MKKSEMRNSIFHHENMQSQDYMNLFFIADFVLAALLFLFLGSYIKEELIFPFRGMGILALPTILSALLILAIRQISRIPYFETEKTYTYIKNIVLVLILVNLYSVSIALYVEYSGLVISSLIYIPSSFLTSAAFILFGLFILSQTKTKTENKIDRISDYYLISASMPVFFGALGQIYNKQALIGIFSDSRIGMSAPTVLFFCYFLLSGLAESRNSFLIHFYKIGGATRFLILQMFANLYIAPAALIWLFRTLIIENGNVAVKNHLIFEYSIIAYLILCGLLSVFALHQLGKVFLGSEQICSQTKKIRMGSIWIDFEKFMQINFGTKFSYSDSAKKRRKKQPKEK